MIWLFILILLSGILAKYHNDKKDFQFPPLENGLASPKKRVVTVPDGYNLTDVVNHRFEMGRRNSYRKR